jgi:hypothetical protein
MHKKLKKSVVLCDRFIGAVGAPPLKERPMKQTHASDMIATIIVMQANKRCHNLIIARVQLMRHIYFMCCMRR